MNRPLFDPKKVKMLRKQQPKMVIDGTFGQCKLTMVNKHNEVLGYFSASQENDSEGDYSVNSVAAKSGYGKFMYVFAMMTLNKQGRMLMCARDADVRPGAENVWHSLLESEGVIKKNVSIEDFSIKGASKTLEIDAKKNGVEKNLFESMLLNDTERTLGNSSIEFGFYNQQVSCKPDSLYENILLKSCNLDKLERKEVLKRGLDYFDVIYNLDTESEDMRLG
jgi:hypothetical protein